MKQLLYMAFFGVVLYYLSMTQGFAEANQVLYLKSGGTLNYNAARVEGDSIVVDIPGGTVKLSHEQLAEKSLYQFYPVRVSIADKLPDELESDKVKKISRNEGHFMVASRLKGNAEIQFDYMVPRDNAGAVPASASNLVFFAPNMTGKPVNSLGRQRLQELCEVYGFTVFTAEFNSDFAEVGDREKCWYYPESGAFEALFQAQAKLVKDFALVEKKLLILGYSGGATMAAHLGLYNSDRVSAVALLSGGRYDKVTQASKVTWCLLSTRGDSRKEENMAFVEQARAMGMNALYAQTPPRCKIGDNVQGKQQDPNFHHSINDAGFFIACRFLVDMAEYRDRGLDLSDLTRWPYAASVADTFAITPNNKNAMSENKVYYPSLKFANLWQRTPYRPVSIHDEKLAQSLSVTVRYPTEGEEPHGVVIWHGNMNEDDGDYLDYLALLGWIAVGAELAPQERIRSGQEQVLLNWVLQQNAWRSYGIYSVGLGGLAARHALLTAAGYEGSRLRGVAAAGAELYWPFPDLSPQEQLSHISASILLLDPVMSDSPGFIEAARRLNKSVEMGAVTSQKKKSRGDAAYLDEISEFFQKL